MKMNEIALKYKLIFVILMVLTLMRCYSLASNIFGFGDGNEVRLFVFSDEGFTSDEIHNYEKLIRNSKNGFYQIVSVRDIKTTAVIQNQTVDITIRNSPDKPFYNNYPYLRTEQKAVTSYSEILDNCVIISEQIPLYDAYGDHPYVTAYFHEPTSMIFGDDIYVDVMSYSMSYSEVSKPYITKTSLAYASDDVFLDIYNQANKVNLTDINEIKFNHFEADIYSESFINLRNLANQLEKDGLTVLWETKSKETFWFVAPIAVLVIAWIVYGVVIYRKFIKSY